MGVYAIDSPLSQYLLLSITPIASTIHSRYEVAAPTSTAPAIAPPTFPAAPASYGTTVGAGFVVVAAAAVLVVLTAVAIVVSNAVPVAVSETFANSVPPTVAQTPCQCVNGGGQYRSYAVTVAVRKLVTCEYSTCVVWAGPPLMEPERTVVAVGLPVSWTIEGK